MSNAAERTTFVTTSHGLDRAHPAMRLYEKAKQFGIWNPSAIDFSQDIEDWNRMTEPQRDLLLGTTSRFQGGEEAVTLDLLPLISAVSRQGHLEEQIFLTAFLWEEAKHTDFFDRFLREVAHVEGSLERYHGPAYHKIFYEALPTALDTLRTDTSTHALARASTTYNMIVEGVLAETGYYGYGRMLDNENLLPGLRQGIAHLRRDESRHIAFGVYLLSRLIAEDDSTYDVIQETLATLFEPTLGMIDETYSRHEIHPFGLEKGDYSEYAQGQYLKRSNRLARARGATLREVYLTTQTIIDQDDA